MEDLAAQVTMAMDGYFSACINERVAIEHYFLLPDLDNRRAWIEAANTRHYMMKVVFERYEDRIIRIVEHFRSTASKEIDELAEQVNHLRSARDNSTQG